MERHPNGEDLRQLEAAERQLARLSGGPSSGGAAVSRRYSLAPLVLPALPLGTFTDEKARLRETSARWLAEFATRLRAQQESGLGRLRRELEAVAEAKAAQRRRAEEVALFDRARALREEQSEEIVNLEIDINTLRARIAIVPPPPDRERLEARVREREVRLEALREAARMAEAQVHREMEERLAQRAREDAGEVERRLAGERAEAARAADALIRKQRAALETTLAALTAPSGTVVGATARGVAGPYVIAAPFAGGKRPDTVLIPAVRRLRAQREALRRFIREDTLAAVRDAAAERNLRPTFDRASAADAPDATAQFARWMNGDTDGDGIGKTSEDRERTEGNPS